MKNKILASALVTALVMALFCSCTVNAKSTVDYSDPDMWAFSEADETKQADVFLIAPTVYYGDSEHFNMSVDDEKNRGRIVGALNMQTGIFSELLNVYSPYYRQASLSSIDSNSYNSALNIAYTDIAAAFEYYMKRENSGRPFVLSGFSQGAALCIRLMEDYPQYLENMIACYIYGYAVTEATVEKYPQIKPAAGECDLGVTICFNSEAPEVNDTFTVPFGEKSICINPLNWKTDGTPADKSLNKGACFTDYDGTVTSEIPEFSGAYMDESRGTLKLTEVNPDDYKPKLTFLKYGEYHLYEYEFFYRNLQENVRLRVQTLFDRQKNEGKPE